MSKTADIRIRVCTFLAWVALLLAALATHGTAHAQTTQQPGGQEPTAQPAPTTPSPQVGQSAENPRKEVEAEPKPVVAGTNSKELAEIQGHISRWEEVLNRVQKQLEQEGLTPALFDQLRETVAVVQTELTEGRPPLLSGSEGIKKLIDALGPAPKEGEPKESAEIATQRQGLNKQLAASEGLLKKLDLLTEQTRALLSGISEAQSDALSNKLLVRTPSLFDSDTWTKTVGQAASLAGQVNSRIQQWLSSDAVRDVPGSGYLLLVLIAALVSAALAWLLRRLLLVRFGRRPEIKDPTFRMRVRASLAEASARTVIPVLVASAVYAALHAGGLLFGFVDKIAFGFVVAIIVVSALHGLPRAMLSPSIPHWRLTAIGDQTALRWYRYALALAAVIAVDMFIVIPVSELKPGAEVRTVYNFLSGSAYALLYFLMAADSKLWLTAQEEVALSRKRKPSEPPATRSRWWSLFRFFSVAMAIAIPVTALLGYSVLSEFIARRMLATAGVFLAAIVLHGLARDLVALFTHEFDKPKTEDEPVNQFYIWSVLFLDIGLVLTMVFVIVPLWGGQWEHLMDRMGWSLTGFKIGDRVFSITDVFAGMLAFIVALAIVRFIQHFIRRRILQHTRMDTGVRDSLTTAIGYAGLVVAFLFAVTMAGFDLSGLTIVAGALGVGVGFGLQSIVNNFVSGLILLAERPIKVGDWVHVGNHEGTVQRISVRSTEIKTFERASVIVPNSELITSPVINWMHKDRSGRVDIPIGVAYGSDVEKVREILLRIAEESGAFLKVPEPYVLFIDFGDSALLFELRGFISQVNTRLRLSSALRFEIEREFREAGIEIPFPQRDLHIRDYAQVKKEAPKPKRRRDKAKPREHDKITDIG